MDNCTEKNTQYIYLETKLNQKECDLDLNFCNTIRNMFFFYFYHIFLSSLTWTLTNVQNISKSC